MLFRKDYVDYANILFKEFGDRVKHWITFNEPFSYCSFGYTGGSFAPGRCSLWENDKCVPGDSGREPYTACHNLLLAHGDAVKLYKDMYQVLIHLFSHFVIYILLNSQN